MEVYYIYLCLILSIFLTVLFLLFCSSLFSAVPLTHPLSLILCLSLSTKSHHPQLSPSFPISFLYPVISLSLTFPYYFVSVSVAFLFRHFNFCNILIPIQHNKTFSFHCDIFAFCKDSNFLFYAADETFSRYTTFFARRV